MMMLSNDVCPEAEALVPSESLHDILQQQTGCECAKINNESDEDEGGGGTSEAEDQRECVTNLLVSPLLLDKHTQCSLTEDKQREQTVKIDLNIRKSSSISTKSQKLTLVRGSSLSLVDLPTFLPSTVTLGKLGNIKNISNISSLINNNIHPLNKLGNNGLVYPTSASRTNHNKMGKKSQWTVMCVALGFFSSCLILVGGMLSVTSEYQDKAIAKMLNISLEELRRNS